MERGFKGVSPLILPVIPPKGGIHLADISQIEFSAFINASFGDNTDCFPSHHYSHGRVLGKTVGIIGVVISCEAAVD